MARSGLTYAGTRWTLRVRMPSGAVQVARFSYYEQAWEFGKRLGGKFVKEDTRKRTLWIDLTKG